MVFSDAHVTAFLNFSGDRNPLHADADYAHRTPFGEIVVPGICVALAALALAPQGRFQRITGRFLQPVFLRREYRFHVADEGNVIRVQALRGAAIVTEIELWRRCDEIDGPPRPADDEIRFRQEALPYSPDGQWLERVLVLYGLETSGVAAGHLAALAWASYFTGVVFPGTQALFSSFDMVFAPGEASEPALTLTDVTGTLDDRFQRTTVTGRAPGVLTAVTLTAFARPLPVTYSADEIAGLSRERSRAPRTAVVTGGSRGLGNVLVRLLMRRGDRVAFVYWHGRAEAEAVALEASQQGHTVLPIQADLTSTADCEHVAETVATAFGSIDLLVNNAAPLARPERFTDQTLAEFEDFVTRSIRTVAAPTQRLIPRMTEGAIVAVLSSQYARNTPASYAHYACAKNAVEGLARGLAADYPDLRFLIARPPRILTDQTNLPFSLERPASAASIGAALITCLDALPAAPPNLHEVDLE